MAFFAPYRIQPTISHLREPIYQSHDLQSQAMLTGKSCKRISIDVAVRPFFDAHQYPEYRLVIGYVLSSTAERNKGDDDGKRSSIRRRADGRAC